eukprot:gb/GFBE01025719.1/.p1 GENE.gb/GFBE01025719.1/~~gb/GFBE01025719.1/.p1  ORF type:complete len:163 (+),score=17.04 gb/GFBE01025719.1/:1-489(+)
MGCGGSCQVAPSPQFEGVVSSDAGRNGLMSRNEQDAQDATAVPCQNTRIGAGADDGMSSPSPRSTTQKLKEILLRDQPDLLHDWMNPKISHEHPAVRAEFSKRSEPSEPGQESGALIQVFAHNHGSDHEDVYVRFAVLCTDCPCTYLDEVVDRPIYISVGRK